MSFTCLNLNISLWCIHTVADPDPVTDGGANRELGLSMLCLGISYCGKPIRVRPHRFTRHGIVEEKIFSVIKGKV